MRSILCAIGFGAFAACSGGGGPVQDVTGDDVSDPSTNQEQAPEDETTLDNFGDEPPEEVEIEVSVLLETLAAEGIDTVVSGLVVVEDPATGTRLIARRDGVYDFETETLTLADAGVTLSSDIPGAFLVSSGATQSDAAVIVGIPTTQSEMPLAGDAVFSGGAAGFVITSAAGFDLTNGQSQVTVNFGTGSVIAELSGFTDVSQISGNELSAPIDTIIWRDAQITGTGFSGGTLETLDDSDVAVDITGENTTFLADGQFFGTDAETLNPAEVGGLIFSEGDDGIVFGSFIAD